MSILSKPYLGELELASLEALWQHGVLDAKALHRLIGEQRGIALTTVQSTLERLFRKQLLMREKVSHAYQYRPAVRREDLMGRLFAEVIDTFSSGKTEQGLAAFVDLAAKDNDENLDKLEQLILQRRGQAEEKN